MSPQSVALPVPQAEQVLPITAPAAGAEQQSSRAVYGSLLHMANSGKHCILRSAVYVNLHTGVTAVKVPCQGSGSNCGMTHIPQQYF